DGKRPHTEETPKTSQILSLGTSTDNTSYNDGDNLRRLVRQEKSDGPWRMNLEQLLAAVINSPVSI
ncbi:MAG: hypothetical protein AAB263_17350, partial [Planctomycetota bacterium]